MGKTDVWFFLLLLVVTGFVIWLIAVHHLMARRDDEFPGHYDKPLWAILLTFTGAFGALVYLFFANPADRTDDSRSSSEDSECLKCGALIPEGQEKCPVCGWTYSAN